MGIINFLIVLSILVFIHELGHFLVARYLGVTVHVFSIGFGKKIFSRQWKGTTWQFALIPLGGYVRMKGQDDSDPSKIEEGNDSYNNKMLSDYLKIEETEVKELLVLYARLELGIKIKNCVEEQDYCSFTAEC